VEIYHAEAINDFNQRFVQLIKLLGEKLTFTLILTAQLLHHLLASHLTRNFVQQLLILNFVALRKDIQVWHSHLNHGAHRCQAAGNHLGGLVDVRPICTVYRAHQHSRLLNGLGKSLHHIQVRV